MKLTAYKDVLKLGKEKVQEAMAPMRAREQRKRAELEAVQIESKICEVEQQIQELCAAYPIDFNKLIKQIDEKALLERRKKQYGEIIEQMFPED
jgi:hypothetical protein